MVEISKPTTRIVKKRSYNEQFFFDDIPSTAQELASSSVRIQAVVIGVTANNLSYCANGDALHWYDVYPLPDGLPEKFNDPNEFAIAPGWGYAKVLESTIPELPPSTMLYGMIPTSSMITDLKLKRSADASAHWTEISHHREKVMSLYCRYIVADADFAPGVEESTRLWRAALVWLSGYLLNRYVFSSRVDDPAISMFPSVVPWSRADADLSKAILITLGSGSKTCRTFVQQVVSNRAEGGGPVALYEVTGGKRERYLASAVPFVHQVMDYGEILSSEVLQQISDHGVDKIVVLDFGGRGNTVEDLTVRLRNDLPQTRVIVLNIGGAPKVNSARDVQARQERASRIKALQMNATDILDAVIAELGEQKTYDLITQEWHRVVESQANLHAGTPREGEFLGMRLDIRYGVRRGMETAWEDICQGKATGDTACVVKF